MNLEKLNQSLIGVSGESISDAPKLAYNEIRGDQELAKKEGNKEAIAKWTPNENDKRLIENLMKEYPALDYNMAETMYMFCKHSPEDAEKMVDGTYEFKYHKDEYYQDIPDGSVFHTCEIDRTNEVSLADILENERQKIKYNECL